MAIIGHGPVSPRRPGEATGRVADLDIAHHRGTAPPAEALHRGPVFDLIDIDRGHIIGAQRP